MRARRLVPYLVAGLALGSAVCGAWTIAIAISVTGLVAYGVAHAAQEEKHE